MNYFEFLNHVIDDAVKAAREDYDRPEQRAKRDASVEALESCRSRLPSDISEMLEKASRATDLARRRRAEDEISHDEYWAVRCREAELEWVANVVSAMLVNQGERPIVVPTCRGVMKAAQILGECR